MKEIKETKWTQLRKDNLLIHILVACIAVLFLCSILEVPLDEHNWSCVIIDVFCGVIWLIGIGIHCKQNYERHSIGFMKLADDAIIPSKRYNDAGYDIYPSFEEAWYEIMPNQTALIPTGIASVFSDDYAAILKERGSTGTKGIGQRAGVIDSNYRGEWFVPITNHSNVPIVICKEEYHNTCLDILDDYGYDNVSIYPYEKAICQAIFVPIPKLDVYETDQDHFVTEILKSDRGTGALGSTGK